MSLHRDRITRMQQSCVCLWVETVNTSNTGDYKDKRTNSGCLMQSGDGRPSEAASPDGPSVFPLCGWTGYHSNTRSSVRHSWHRSNAETEKSDAALNILSPMCTLNATRTAGGSAVQSHWLTGAANHELRLPDRLASPPLRLFLNQPVCQTLPTHGWIIQTDYQTENMALLGLLLVATRGIAAKVPWA